MTNMFNEGDMVVFAEPPDERLWPAHKEYYDIHSLERCVGTVARVDRLCTLSLPYYVKWETIGGECAGYTWCSERWLRSYNNSIGYAELDDFLSGFKS